MHKSAMLPSYGFYHELIYRDRIYRYVNVEHSFAWLLRVSKNYKKHPFIIKGRMC